MQFGKYQFKCTLQKEAHFPPYKGSTFRGGFGVALKKYHVLQDMVTVQTACLPNAAFIREPLNIVGR